MGWVVMLFDILEGVLGFYKDWLWSIDGINMGLLVLEEEIGLDLRRIIM